MSKNAINLVGRTGHVEKKLAIKALDKHKQAVEKPKATNTGFKIKKGIKL